MLLAYTCRKQKVACAPNAKPKMMGLDQYKDKMAELQDHCITQNVRVFLDSIKNEVKVPVREENASPNEVMGWSLCELFNSLYHFFSDMITAKLIDKFIIVDLFARCAGDGVGVDHKIFLFLFLFYFRLFNLSFLNCLLFFLFDSFLIFWFC